jgi:hypothetical protein
VQKVLEGANVKLGNVLSDLFGKSGQDMLEALLENEKSPAEIADLARRRARSKIAEIRAALEGHRMRKSHRFVIQQSLDLMAFLEEQIGKLDEQIQEALKPFEKEYELLQTVPALKKASAAEMIAEIGVDMKVFGSAPNLASWGGKCPGSNESAGKHKSTRTCRGNRWLGAVLGECSWAASRTKGTVFRDKFQRIAPRRGKKKAAVAVAHALLVAAYYVLEKRVPYQELNTYQRDENRRAAQARYYLGCLERLGVKVQRTESNMETAEGLIVLGRVTADGSKPSQETGASGTTPRADRRSAPKSKKSCAPKTKRTPRIKAAPKPGTETN